VVAVVVRQQDEVSVVDLPRRHRRR
jgi:hypothetical protein